MAKKRWRRAIFAIRASNAWNQIFMRTRAKFEAVSVILACDFPYLFSVGEIALRKGKGYAAIRSCYDPGKYGGFVDCYS